MIHRPAFFAAASLALGISLAAQFPTLIPAIGPFALAGILLLLVLRQNLLVRLLSLAAALALIGALLASLEWTSYRDTTLTNIASLKPASVVVTGTLLSTDETKREYQWLFETDSLAISRDHAVPIAGRIILYLSKSAHGHVRRPDAGARLRVYCSLEPFQSATNPFEFASDRRIQRQLDAEAQGHIESRFDYYILSRPPPGILSGISNTVAAAHSAILTLLDSAIADPDARGFVEAVVLGDRSDMDKETLGDFTTSGVAHILAVSGFNVAIVALVVAQLLRLFGIYGFRTRTAITMGTVLLYAAIVGFQPSVVRALLMIEFYLTARLLERKPDPLNIVMSAAAINLVLRPFDLFDVGFQLSYAGVLGMIVIAPKILWFFRNETPNMLPAAGSDGRLLHSRFAREVGTATALSIGASLASYPVIATHFYRISFIGLAANVPLVPLSAIITALGFLLIPVTAISQWLGQLYGEAATYLTHALLLLTHFSAHLPHAAHAAAPPNWIFLTLLAAAILYCVRATARPQFAGRILLSLAAFFALFEIGVPFSNSVLARNEGKLQVMFFDVGQGDCILLHTPAGKNYFIDFGKANYSGAAIEQAALPFLRAEDIMRIDAGFISHMHVDHYGGAPAVLEHCSVGALYSSGERVPGFLARQLDTEANSFRVLTRVLARGDTLQLDSDLVLYVTSPDPHVRTSELTDYGENIHNGMLAFKLVYRHTSFLFLGDLERSDEEAMLANYGSFLRTNVVKVAHHGSLTSSSRAFIAGASPQYAVISVGEYNHFGHPAPAIVRRWMAGGASVLRTDRDGAVLLVSDGNEVRRVNWKG